MELPARRPPQLVVVLLLMTVSAAACGADAPAQSSSARPDDLTTPAPATATATPDRGHGEQDASPVPEILRFTAPRLGGGTIDGETFAGSDVALWFWAPW